MSADALAQNVPPIAVELGATVGGRLDENAPRRPTNHAFACYALNTKPGDQVSIRVTSSAFDPVLEVARGALCSAAALQFENDNVNETSTDAQVSFRAAGGRYLILVRGNAAASSGPFRLLLQPAPNAAANTQTPVSDEAERRRQIMAMEIEKRNAEIAAAQAKRQAEQAAAEAQRLAWLAQEQEAQSYDRYENDYEEDYEPAPTRNFMDVFASTLASELEANQRQEAEFQRNIEQAVRRGEAEYQRRMAAEASQQAQQRQDQAMRQAAAQQAQAAEAQRQAAERARAAADASRRLALAQEQRATPAQRNSDRIVAYPAGGQTPTNSSQSNRASTRNDPASCVSGPELVKNPNCPNGAGARVINQCADSIDARVCHWTTRDRWDCGITSVRPGKTGGYPSCYGTGRMWMQVQYSDSRTKFADPP